jgi:hypothetical protein
MLQISCIFIFPLNTRQFETQPQVEIKTSIFFQLVMIFWKKIIQWIFKWWIGSLLNGECNTSKSSNESFNQCWKFTKNCTKPVQNIKLCIKVDNYGYYIYIYPITTYNSNSQLFLKKSNKHLKNYQNFVSSFMKSYGCLRFF